MDIEKPNLKLPSIYMTLLMTSCEAERNFISIIKNYELQHYGDSSKISEQNYPK